MKRSIENVKQHMVVNQSASDVGSIACVPILNWTAMSLFNAKYLKLQHQSLADLMTANLSAPVVMLPTYHYKKGHLYKLEGEANTLLANHGLNLDRTVYLSFSERCDDRSEMPMVVRAVVPWPMDEDKNCDRLKFWKSVPLFKSPNKNQRPRHCGS